MRNWNRTLLFLVGSIIVRRVDDWSWSSYGAMVGDVPKPDWLTVDWLLSQFGGSLKEARLAYQKKVCGTNAKPC